MNIAQSTPARWGFSLLNWRMDAYAWSGGKTTARKDQTQQLLLCAPQIMVCGADEYTQSWGDDGEPEGCRLLGGAEGAGGLVAHGGDALEIGGNRHGIIFGEF